MQQQIANIALVVKDYDEAIAWYRDNLQFTLIEDTTLSDQKRWVLMSPPGSSGTRILLAKAKNEKEKSRIGDQTGGRVFLFLFTDDFWRDYKSYGANGVEFIRDPKKHDYGTVSVFKDLYGNLWDLIEPNP